jgi:hypothetical protein
MYVQFHLESSPIVGGVRESGDPLYGDEGQERRRIDGFRDDDANDVQWLRVVN